MSGSAFPLLVFRGCKLHFMLRPADLLPLSRLSTPRFTSRHLCLKWWPASGLSGDYPGGGFTRW